MAFPLTSLSASLQYALQHVVIRTEESHAMKVLLAPERRSCGWVFRKCAYLVEYVLERGTCSNGSSTPCGAFVPIVGTTFATCHPHKASPTTRPYAPFTPH